MRWYFAIDEAGASGQTGEDAKTAVLSALNAGGLEPRLLYHGERGEFCAWMERHGVTIIDAEPSFLGAIRQAQDAGTYKPHSIGHWLRVAVPLIEQEHTHILYTDCDVIFLRPFDWSFVKPAVFAAAPEFKPDNWNYFNAGVMVLNVPAMRATYPAFEALVRNRIAGGAHPYYDDELALNEAYRGLWDRLHPILNWKPYWGFSAQARLLHFHGPKLNVIESIAAGTWHTSDPTAEIMLKFVTAFPGAYQTWASELGDRLQLTNPALALRLHAVAGALQRMQRVENPDTEFLNFNMFPE